MSNWVRKLDQFWRKYDFPLQFLVLRDITTDRLACLFWTRIARWQLWLYGANVGSNLCVKGRLVVLTRRRGSIVIGHQVMLVSRFRSNPIGLTGPVVLDTRMGGCIKIGDCAGLSSVVLSSRSLIQIGRYVKLGGNVRIFDHDYHSLHHEHRRDGRQDREHVRVCPVVIEDDVFVGAHAMILKGTHIGARSVIGAGAVVAGLDIPPDSLVVGNPATIVGRAGGSQRSDATRRDCLAAGTG